MTYSIKFWKELFSSSYFLRMNNQEEEKVLSLLSQHTFSNDQKVILIYDSIAINRLEKYLNMTSKNE